MKKSDVEIGNLLNIEPSLVTITGESASGKTFLLRELLFNSLDRGKKTIFYSLDSTQKFPKSFIRDQRINFLLGNTENCTPSFKFFNINNCRSDELINIINRSIDVVNPEFIFIDGVSNISLSNITHMNASRNMEHIIRTIQNLSIKNNIVTFLTMNSYKNMNGTIFTNSSAMYLSSMVIAIRKQIVNTEKLFQINSIKNRHGSKFESHFKIENERFLKI